MGEEKRDKIKEAFKKKTWSEIKSTDSWKIFQVMSELVEGFDKLAEIGPCVSIFGSARTSSDNKYYIAAEECAAKLANSGYGVITGGGPGIMEAGNKGAKKENGSSVGLNITLPFEQSANIYIDSDKLINFNHFYVRKHIFVRYSQGFIVFPGGFGTLDELFEALTLIQTEKAGKFPIILYGSSYWKGLIDWTKEVMLEMENNISPEDMDLFQIVDSIDDACAIIDNFYSKYLHTTNF